MACPTRASIPGVDAELTPFGCEIAGCVNGAQAELLIEGSVAPREVKFETKIAFPGEPLLWDETILVLATIDPVVLLSLNPDAVRRDSAPQNFQVESGVFDEGQMTVGRIVMAGCFYQAGGRVEARAQIVEGWLSFEPMERVTQVGVSMPMSLLSTDAGETEATRIWAGGTSRGNSLSGVSVLRASPVALDRDLLERVLYLQWVELSPGEVAGPQARRVLRVAGDCCDRP